MTTFFSDLDNTLLYSHRHPLPGKPVLVETLRGKPQSFMTEKTYRYFQTLDWLSVIPVTTRTRDQFTRLEGMAEAFGWRTALVCNGSVLLRDGQEDPAWSEESRRLAAEAQPALEAAYTLACTLADPADLIDQRPFLFYIRGGDPGAVLSALQAQADLTQLTLLRDARKVYCFPQVLNKGTAVTRYRNAFGVSRVLAAGDSAFDLPMLEAADRCFCPGALSGQVENRYKTVCGAGIFSDLLCDGLETLRNEENTIDTQRQRKVQRGGTPLHPRNEDEHRGHGDPGDPGTALLPGPVPGGYPVR